MTLVESHEVRWPQRSSLARMWWLERGMAMSNLWRGRQGSGPVVGSVAAHEPALLRSLS